METPLAIDGTPYDLVAIAVRPRRGGGPDPTYHLRLDAEGRVRCTCPDFRYRRDDAGELCKHGRAAIAAGLLPAAPIPRH